MDNNTDFVIISPEPIRHNTKSPKKDKSAYNIQSIYKTQYNTPLESL